MHSGSETWSLGLNVIGILRRTEGAMARSMCGDKLMIKMSTKYLRQMFDMNETINMLARANSVR